MVTVTDSPNDPAPRPGQRHRFHSAGAPAMAPAPRAASSRPVTGSSPRHGEDLSYLDRAPTSSDALATNCREESTATEQPSDAAVVKTTGSMAVATLLSRITGFVRTVLIGAALGEAVGSAFNIANTLPNLITELVLGAVLTSLVVPLLVRAEKEDPDRGAAFIRRLFTLTFTLMLAVTILAVVAAPLLTRIALDEDSKVDVGMSTSFAYLLLPQIVFYAVFSVMMAVLNTKGYFKPGAWAPVANNVVTIGVLGLYYLLPHSASGSVTDPHMLLLGLGTTTGVVVQALIMVPYLKKAGIDLRPLWGLDARLKKFGGMALAIVVYVLISQIGFVLNNRIAAAADEGAPIIYAQAWQLLQMPYGIIGVTLLTAFMPRLSRNAADGDDKAVVKDLSTATRLTMLAMVPVIVYLTAFGTVIGPALFGYGNFSDEAANVLGWTISFSAFTLIPYAMVLLHLRVFYAREEVWTPTFIIAGITVTKLVLAYLAPHVASEPRLVVVLLAAANGMGFVAGAIIGQRLLRRSLGNLDMRSVLRTAGWALGASVIAGVIAWRVDVLLTHFVVSETSSLGYIVRLFVTGVLFVLLAGAILSFSKLPEVLMIASMLARLPGIGRFFAKAAVSAESLTEATETVPTSTKITAISLGDTGSGMDETGMVGALPPLSAGRVRGPRLVPGAPILSGRFRLLANHGGSPAAQLWQARDNTDGDLVALTVIDTLKSGRSAREIVNATAQLADATANSPAVALVREICNAGSVVVVVADWTEGAPLTRAAESGPDPLAAGYAMVDLADAAGAGFTLGIDHRNRLRISTEGRAVLAFPGVIPTGSSTAAGPMDNHAIGVSLALLLSKVPKSEVPASLTTIVNAARAGEITDGHELARELRLVTQPDDQAHTGPHLRATADVAPVVSDQTGFGAAPEHRGRMTVLGISTVAGVIAVVSVIAIVLAVIGGDRKDSPLTTDSIRGGSGLGTVGIVHPTGVSEWAPADGRGTPDSPETAGLIIDGNEATSWSSAQYQTQFGLPPHSVKDGIGLLLSLPDARALTEVLLTGVRPGMTVELRSASGEVTSLDQTRLIASGTATGTTLLLGPPSAPVDGDEGTSHLPAPGDRVLLWITGLPMPEAATIAEVTVHGAPVVKKESDVSELAPK